MWVSAGWTELKIYIYKISDPARPLVDSFAQTGGPSGWGIRDMAYRNSADNVLAGFDNARFHAYDATTHIPANTYTVTGYSGTVRAMSWHPDEDSLWTGNFANSPMTKFSISGTNGHSVKPASEMGSCFGLAYDDLQSCFWMTNAGVTGASPVWKIDYPGYAVSDSFNPAGWDLGGGCEMWRDTLLLAVEQGDSTPDRIWCFRFRLGPPPPVDVGIVDIVRPTAVVMPGPVYPKVIVRNFGSQSQANIPVRCLIDSVGSRVYDWSTVHAGTLDPGMTDSVVLSQQWYPGAAGTVYDLAAFTYLGGDSVPSNDTMRRTVEVSGAVFSDSIFVRRLAYSAPTIDGVMAPGEWSHAVWYDISDLAGRGGTPRPVGSAYAWFLYDSAPGFVYVACAMPGVGIHGDHDQIGLYVDEDASRAWSIDSSEGNHWADYAGGMDSVVYRALLDTVPHTWRMPGQCPGCFSASGVNNGRLEIEARIPVGERKGDWDVWPGKRVWLYILAASTPGSVCRGWWPQSLAGTRWADPRYYGIMLFEGEIGVQEPGTVDSRRTWLRATSPVVRDFGPVSYSVENGASAYLGVFDAGGRLVCTLVRGAVEPGVHEAVWGLADERGRRVPAGAYFYRLVAGGSSVSSKVLVPE